MSHGQVLLEGGKAKSIYEAVGDTAWLKDGFVSKVQKRGAEIIAVMKKSSAASAASAACDHVHGNYLQLKN